MRPIMHDTTTAIRGFARSHQLPGTGLPYFGQVGRHLVSKGLAAACESDAASLGLVF